jgi:threonine dehydrogenase-like Zn-dependent dehydrogenase
MKIPFVFGPDDLRMCEVEPPRAGPRDVVIRVATVGVCGSDLGYVSVGGLAGPTEEPMPLGHELSGVVAQAGPEVTSVAVGDRVIINPYFNYIGNGGPEGGFGDELLVRDVAGQPASLLRLPDEIDFDTGALVEPLAVSMHGVNRSGARPGDKVAIFGAGPIGLGAVAILRHRGIDDVVVFDLSAFRRERALKLGARAAIDPRETPPAQALMELHGKTSVYGQDAPQTTHYLEMSGAPVINDIVGFAKLGVTLCVSSVQKKPVTLDFQTLLAKEFSILMAMGYPDEFGPALDMVKNGGIDLEPMVSHRFKGDDFLAAFEAAKQQDRAAKVLVQYNA